MIKVIKVNKEGNKVLNYVCTDGKSTKLLSKEQLAMAIEKKLVENARMQVYQGRLIIRVTDDVDKETTSTTPQQTCKPKQELKIAKEPTIEVTQVNKQGNRILSYTCNDGKKTRDLTREQLAVAIDRKMVKNATKQIYQSKIIIRVSNEVPVNVIPSENETEEKVTSSHENKVSVAPLNKYMQMYEKAAKIGQGKEIQAGDGKKAYLMWNNKDYILYIPDDVQYINDSNAGVPDSFARQLRNIRGKLKVAGGKSLQNAKNMFKETQFISINLDELDDRCNLMSGGADGMFESCEAGYIKFNASRNYLDRKLELNIGAFKNYGGFFETANLELKEAYDKREIHFN